MFAGIFGLLAVESFVVDPNAMAAAVAGGLTFGRVALVGVLVVVGLGLFFKDQLAAVWAESKAAATTAAKTPSNPALPQAKAGTAGTVTFNVLTSAVPDDDLSQGIALLRSLAAIYERQGMSRELLNQMLMEGIEELLPKVPPVTPSKTGGAA